MSISVVSNRLLGTNTTKHTMHGDLHPTRYILWLKESDVQTQTHILGDMCLFDAEHIRCSAKGRPDCGGLPFIIVSGAWDAVASLAGTFDDFVKFVEVDQKLRVPNITFPVLETYVSDEQIAFEEHNSAGSWGLDRINSRQWPMDGKFDVRRSGGSGVDVYVLDTGIDIHLPEFEGRAHAVLDFFVGGNKDTLFECDDTVELCAHDVVSEFNPGHGTHIAGTIGSRSYGVAKGASLHSIRTIDESGDGAVLNTIEALEWLLQSKRPRGVISMSSGWLGRVHPSVEEIFEELTNRGFVVVASSGNFGDVEDDGGMWQDACLFVPQSIPNVITVGGMVSLVDTQIDKRAAFSSHGSCVDIFAPGQFIMSTVPVPDATIEERLLSGTSFACPHVSGAVALLLEEYPDITVSEVTQRLLKMATKGVVEDPKGSNLLLYVENDPWSVTDGNCAVRFTDGMSCVESPNFPEKYDNDESCTIDMDSDAWIGRSIVLNVFDAESDFDMVTITANDVETPYSGNYADLNGKVPGGYLTWISNHGIEKSGWSVCASQRYWSVRAGNCGVRSISGMSCVESPNYPENYGNNEACTIDASSDGNSDVWVGSSIFVNAFDTESYWDYLIVKHNRGNRPWSGGSAALNGIVPEDMYWQSDSSVTKSGWSICASSILASPQWSVIFGKCRVRSVRGMSCVESPNYAENDVDSTYGENERCKIHVNSDAWIDSSIFVNAFDTELDYDFLTVTGNGVETPYSGNYADLNGKVPEGYLTWISDPNTEKSGWSICANQRHWLVREGNCKVTFTKGMNCVESPNYAENDVGSTYGNLEYCIIDVNSDAWIGNSIYVNAFDTELGYDFLTVTANGVETLYSGDYAELYGKVPEGSLTWFSDWSLTKSGWSICVTNLL